MGVSDHHQYPLLEVVPLDLKGNSNGSIMKRRVVWRRSSSSSGAATNVHKRPKRILMKRRLVGPSSRRTSTAGNGIVRRVRTLKRLIPNSNQSQGLDGLFRETADYILSLQMRVRVMQIMVKVLSGSEDI